jgi:glycine/D-amino acid oxidase-like deaminating enzyme
MKIIVVGAGIMGLSTAWALAKSGQDVELFEQGPLPNPLASSMDEHRLIRHPYGDHTGYARLVDDAFEAWDELWRDLGEKLFAATGTLALTGNGADWALRSAASLESLGRPMTKLSLDDLPRRFPMLDAKGVEHAYWIETGGLLFAQDITSALARHLARQPNVRLHSYTPIRSVDLEQGRVSTEGGTVHSADTVVVAAGTWVDRLLPAARGRLVPSRQVVVYFRLPDDQRAAWARGPMLIDKTGEVGLYLVPPMDGRGMKVGDHEFSRSGDPDGSREATPAEMKPLLDRCATLLRGFERWRIDRLKVCFYTVTADERFVVEKQGARGWLMSPCSGHGFKFGALMGRELARTLVSERDPDQHARWAAGLEGDK